MGFPAMNFMRQEVYDAVYDAMHDIECDAVNSLFVLHRFSDLQKYYVGAILSADDSLFKISDSYLSLLFLIASDTELNEYFVELHADDIMELNRVVSSLLGVNLNVKISYCLYDNVSLNDTGIYVKFCGTLLSDKNMISKIRNVFLENHMPDRSDFADDGSFGEVLCQWSNKIQTEIKQICPSLLDGMKSYKNGTVFAPLNGAMIRLMRERIGLTQKAFAAKYSIPVGTLSQWEQGVRNPPGYVCMMIKEIARLEQLIPKHTVRVLLGNKKIPVAIIQNGKNEHMFASEAIDKYGDCEVLSFREETCSWGTLLCINISVLS